MANDTSHLGFFLSVSIDPNLRGHLEKFNIRFYSHIFLESLYMWGSQKKIWGKKSLLNFSG